MSSSTSPTTPLSEARSAGYRPTGIVEAAPFATFPSAGSVRFGPGGLFGTDLFAVPAFEAGSTVDTIDSSGTVTTFSDPINSAYINFGPGGAWGNDLYASVQHDRRDRDHRRPTGRSHRSSADSPPSPRASTGPTVRDGTAT